MMSATKEKLKEAIGELVAEGEEFVLYEALLSKTNIVADASNKQLKKPSKKIEISKDPNEKMAIDIDEELRKSKSYQIFSTAYQKWYSKAVIVVKQILPDRYDEFTECYKPSKNRKEITALNYTISDYLLRNLVIGWNKEAITSIFGSKLIQQVEIFNSCLSRLDSILSDIQATLQAELFDNEISAAERLLKTGHLRSAGALVGVTLERHFTAVAQNHLIKISKKNPTISDFNDLFKNAGIYDVTTWRFIQFLGDIRNLSSHFKDREPTKAEIEDMINGTQKILKTVF